MLRRACILLLLLTTALLAGCNDSEVATTIAIDFPDGRSDVTATVAGLEQVARGATGGPAHPDGYTAHDQLLAWSRQSGTAVTVQAFSFGYCLDAIDAVPQPGSCGTGAQAYWALSVNGEPSQVGMDQAILADGDRVQWTYTPLGEAGGAASEDGGLGLVVDVPVATRTESVTLTGLLATPATLTAGPVSMEAPAGPWSLEVPVPPGRTLLRVLADDGTQTQAVDVLLRREVAATFEARFSMAVPPRDPITAEVWYDPHAFAAAPMYEGTSLAHPGQPIVHDLMVTWEQQSGKAIDYSGPGSFGFGVERIDGVGQPLTSSAPPWWCYTVNGSGDVLGISAQPLLPGDVVVWEYASC